MVEEEKKGNPKYGKKKQRFFNSNSGEEKESSERRSKRGSRISDETRMGRVYQRKKKGLVHPFPKKKTREGWDLGDWGVGNKS